MVVLDLQRLVLRKINYMHLFDVAEAGINRDNFKANSTTVHALAPNVAETSATIVLTFEDKRFYLWGKF